LWSGPSAGGLFVNDQILSLRNITTIWTFTSRDEDINGEKRE
jgi:hypothetical protein